MEVEEPTEKHDFPLHTRGPVEEGGKKTLPQGCKMEVKTIENEDKQEKLEMEEANSTRVVYSKEDLMAMRVSPASQVRPSILADEYLRNGVWDPELWHQSSESEKRCASPVDDIRRQLLEDDIVLSPQRQSFGQGCHVPQSAPERGLQQDRTKSMLSRTDGRSRLTGRVGRGSRSLDYRDGQPLRDRNRNVDPRQVSPWEREQGGKERGEREGKRSREQDVYAFKRGRRKEDKEPEWMTYGPTSQLETIELRGFDKDEVFPGRRGKKNSLTDSADRASPLVNNKTKVCTPSSVNKQSETPVKDEKVQEEVQGDGGFDINQFFMSDTILQFSGVTEQSNSSRFSQFFGGYGSSHSGSRSGSRRSSTAEELMEYSGLSSGSPSTPRTPSPSQPFVFTPIKPVDASTEPESLAEMLEKTKIDVKPLLDNVMSTGKNDAARVKGSCRLEDVEQDVAKVKETANAIKVVKQDAGKNGQDMAAFFKLVETMKSSGNLPEKPQPVIPGLPSHFLPRPPSPKRKTPRKTPSPLQKLCQSPSPTELVQQIMMQAQMVPPKPPSPAQVVPQLDRSHSPFEILHKSIVMSPYDLLPSPMSRRSPSPLMYGEKSFKPLLGPEAFTSPVSQQQYMAPRSHHKELFIERPYFELSNDGRPSPVSKMHTGKPIDVSKPKPVGRDSSSAFRDPGFMPTSVLLKIKKDQKTPKAKPVDKDVGEKGNVPNGVKEALKDMDHKPVNGTANEPNNRMVKQEVFSEGRSLSPKSQLLREIAAHGPSSKVPFGAGAQSSSTDNQPMSPLHSRTMACNLEQSPLLKPTAFRPYHGSPHSVSPLRAGSKSEPQSPMFSRGEASPNHSVRPLPLSAPVTPQRHPHAQCQLPLPFQGVGDRVANQIETSQLTRHPKFDALQRSQLPPHHGVHTNGPLSTVRHKASEHEQVAQQHAHLPGGIKLDGSDSSMYKTQRFPNRQDGTPEHLSKRVASDVQQQNWLNEGHDNPGAGKTVTEMHLQYRREDVDHRSVRRGVPEMHHNRQDPLHVHPAHRQPLQDMFHQQEMYRHRPPHMPGGRISSQSLLGSPGIPRTPFNSPMPGMQPHPKSGMLAGMMRSPIHPAFMRMMPPSKVRVPATQISMMPVQSLYGPGIGGYGQVNSSVISPHYAIPPRHPANNYGPGRVSSPQPLQPEPSANRPAGDNILSKWFSDDVLRSTQTKTPVKTHNAPDFGKKVLSVEELERQQTAVNT